MNAIIRKAKDADIESIIRIHQAAFDGFFLTSLGDRFLKVYYSSFIKSDDGAVFCAVVDDKVAGFSAVSFISRGFNSSLIKKNLLPFGIMALRLLFTKPKALLRLMKNMDKKDRESIDEDDRMYAELYSIAVDPVCQGSGIGGLLLSITESETFKHNDRISLTTDYFHNDKVIEFYHSKGYMDYYDFIAFPERRMWRMIKTLGRINI